MSSGFRRVQETVRIRSEFALVVTERSAMAAAAAAGGSAPQPRHQGARGEGHPQRTETLLFL